MAGGHGIMGPGTMMTVDGCRSELADVVESVLDNVQDAGNAGLQDVAVGVGGQKSSGT